MDAGRSFAVVALTVAVVLMTWFLMRRREGFTYKEGFEGFAGSAGSAGLAREGFATIAMTDAEKNQWKERMQAMVKYMIMWGFLGMNPEKTAVYSMFDSTRGQAIFNELLLGPLTADAAKYYNEKLWVSTVDWEGSVLYGDAPLTYRDIDQYVRTHPMFSSDQWEQTLTKSMDSLSYINFYYNQAVVMERNLAQIVPSNPIVGGQWRKRTRYLLCALQNSTTYETFQTALTRLGFNPGYFVYTANPFLYRRLKKIYDTYTGATALTHLENQTFIYFQWEILLGQMRADMYGRMTESLDRLADNCSGAALSIPAVSSSGTGAGSGGAGVSASGSGRTQLQYSSPESVAPWAIGSPAMTIPAKPVIDMPVITPTEPAGSVPFSPLDSKGEQKVFKWVIGLFLGLAALLWAIFLFMFVMASASAPSSAPSGQAIAPSSPYAPATPPQTSVQAPVFPQKDAY